MAQDPPVLLGVDAGGTRTRCAVVDAEGKLLWKGASSAGSITSVGVEGAAAIVHSLWDEACRSLGERSSALVGVAAGFAGGRSARLRNAVGSLLAQRFADQPRQPIICITHDAETALVGARGASGAGGIVISGTGSICMVRNEEGGGALAGGWGWPLGDEGSAVWVGWMAVRRALTSLEAGIRDALVEVVLMGWGMAPPDKADSHAVMREAIRARVEPALFGDLAERVCDLARSGDAASVEILVEAGNRLGSLVAEACDRSGWVPGETLRLSLLGGLASAAVDLLEEPIRDGAGPFGEGLEFQPPWLPPVGGAILMAAAAADIDVSGFNPAELQAELR